MRADRPHDGLGLRGESGAATPRPHLAPRRRRAWMDRAYERRRDPAPAGRARGARRRRPSACSASPVPNFGVRNRPRASSRTGTGSSGRRVSPGRTSTACTTVASRGSGLGASSNETSCSCTLAVTGRVPRPSYFLTPASLAMRSYWGIMTSADCAAACLAVSSTSSGSGLPLARAFRSRSRSRSPNPAPTA